MENEEQKYFEKFIKLANEWFDEYVDQELYIYDKGLGQWRDMTIEDWKKKFAEDIKKELKEK